MNLRNINNFYLPTQEPIRKLELVELATEWLRNPEAYKVDEMKDINSKDADFSPAYARDDLE